MSTKNTKTAAAKAPSKDTPPAEPTAEELAAKAAEDKAAEEAGNAAEEKAAAAPAEGKLPKKKAGKLVELAHKETGFFDSVTGFQIVRDQQVELGETIGEKTNEALLSGRLLIVNDK
jgi:hypothetical protein